MQKAQPTCYDINFLVLVSLRKGFYAATESCWVKAEGSDVPEHYALFGKVGHTPDGIGNKLLLVLQQHGVCVLLLARHEHGTV